MDRQLSNIKYSEEMSINPLQCDVVIINNFQNKLYWNSWWSYEHSSLLLL